MRFRSSASILGLLLVAGCTRIDETSRPTAPTLELVPQSSGTEALLQAVSAVNANVVWVSGHEATWARTIDAGEHWSAATVPGAEEMQFRDVAAFSSERAYLMSAGEGDRSRIYRTDDGGSTWRLQYTASHPAAFLDCMDFWSADRGLVYGDAIDGVPFVLTTSNGGEEWNRVPSEALPPALEGEGGFAASGTCLRTGDAGRAWIATGNGERARVLRTEDYGASWSVVDLPLVAGPSAGLATISMADTRRGIALGGLIGDDAVRTENAALTDDGGLTWTRTQPPAVTGPIYGSEVVAVGEDTHVLAVGPKGIVWSTDFGASWLVADTLTHWAVGFAAQRPDRGWAVGPGGRITRLSIGLRRDGG